MFVSVREPADGNQALTGTILPPFREFRVESVVPRRRTLPTIDNQKHAGRDRETTLDPSTWQCTSQQPSAGTGVRFRERSFACRIGPALPQAFDLCNMALLFQPAGRTFIFLSFRSHSNSIHRELHAFGGEGSYSLSNHSCTSIVGDVLLGVRKAFISTPI